MLCHSPVFLVLKYPIHLIMSLSHDSHSLSSGKTTKLSSSLSSSFQGKNATKVCGTLSSAMKPLKKISQCPFPSFFCLKILCEPKTHMDKAELGVNLSSGAFVNRNKRAKRNPKHCSAFSQIPLITVTVITQYLLQLTLGLPQEGHFSK